MKKHIKKIIAAVICLAVVAGLTVTAVSASDYITAKNNYEEAQTAYTASQASLQEAQENLATLESEYGDALAIVTAHSDVVIDRTAEEYASEITRTEAALEEARTRRNLIEEQYNDGAFAFYEWVAENYPEYSEDAGDALDILNAAVSLGYLERGSISDPTSIYGMKLSITFMKQYNALAAFNGCESHNTSFAAVAWGQANGGYTHVYGGHNPDSAWTPKLQRYGENIGPAISYLGYPAAYPEDYIFYNGEVKHNADTGQSPVNVASDSSTYTDWIAHLREIGLYEACPFMEDAHVTPWRVCYIEEGYAYENELYTSFGQIGHYWNITNNFNNPNSLLGFCASSDPEHEHTISYVTDWLLRGVNTDSVFSISVEEFESVLDAYYASLGRSESIAEITSLEEELETLNIKYEVAVAEETVASYDNAAAELSTVIDERQSGLDDARNAYFDARTVFMEYEPEEADITASNAQDGIILRWEAVSYNAEYKIYKKTSGEWTLLYETSETYFKDTAVDAYASYEYCVQTINQKGRGSAYGERAVSFTYVPSPSLKVNAYTSNKYAVITVLNRSADVTYNYYLLDNGEVLEKLTDNNAPGTELTSSLRIYGEEYTGVKSKPYASGYIIPGSYEIGCVGTYNGIDGDMATVNVKFDDYSGGIVSDLCVRTDDYIRLVWNPVNTEGVIYVVYNSTTGKTVAVTAGCVIEIPKQYYKANVANKWKIYAYPDSDLVTGTSIKTFSISL